MRTPERYLERIGAGIDPGAGDEHLDGPTSTEEAFVLALRTRDGAPAPAGAEQTVAELVDARLLTRHDDRFVLTRRGRLLAGDVTARILVSAGRPRARAGTR